MKDSSSEDVSSSVSVQYQRCDIDIKPTVVLISALSENRVIGRGGEIPWDIPADQSRFRDLTSGHPVILGRKTFENIYEKHGGGLPDRTMIVLSKSGDIPESDDIVQASDFNHAVELANMHAADLGVGKVYVAGGESVYRLFSPISDRMELTIIHKEVGGDSYFPQWDDVNWEVENRVNCGELYSFVTYVNVADL